MKEELEETQADLDGVNKKQVDMKRMYEKEVELRLKFEAKMNHLHAIHWDTETKYEWSVSEIDALTIWKDELSSTAYSLNE